MAHPEQRQGLASLQALLLTPGVKRIDTPSRFEAPSGCAARKRKMRFAVAMKLVSTPARTAQPRGGLPRASMSGMPWPAHRGARGYAGSVRR